MLSSNFTCNFNASLCFQTNALSNFSDGAHLQYLELALPFLFKLTYQIQKTPLLLPAFQTESPRFQLAFQALLIAAMPNLWVDLTTFNMPLDTLSTGVSPGINLPCLTLSFLGCFSANVKVSDTTAAAVSVSSLTLQKYLS